MEEPRKDTKAGRPHSWREKQKAKGDHSITLWLDLDSVARLSRLVARFEEPAESVVGRALRQLERAVGRAGERASTHPAENGIRLPREAVLQQLQALHAQGLGPQAIASQLSADGVSTLSGRGRWNRGTVSALLTKLKHQASQRPG